jgi:hypothetical protein
MIMDPGMDGNRGVEDQIETFPYFFCGFTIGKLLSLLKAQKPYYIGVVPY